jgi:hypothetical protein
MGRITTSAIVILFVLGSTGAMAHEPAAISKREARTLPAPQVERRVMAQLSNILEEERWDRRRPPVRPLTDLDFVTKPRPTPVPRLCRVDRLKVSFRPMTRGKGDADTPVLADGFTASHYFHFSQAPNNYFEELADYDRHQGGADCMGLSFTKEEFFEASSEEVATNGFFLARRVIDAILGGKPAFPVECNKSPEDRICADIVRNLMASIDSIEECEAEKVPLAGCYRIYAGDRVLRIVASPIAFGANALPPLTPLDVKVEELIILADERVD